MAKIAKKTAARRKASRVKPRRARPAPQVVAPSPLTPKQFDEFRLHDAVRCVGRDDIGVIVGLMSGTYGGEPFFQVRFRGGTTDGPQFDRFPASHLFFA